MQSTEGHYNLKGIERLGDGNQGSRGYKVADDKKTSQPSIQQPNEMTGGGNQPANPPVPGVIVKRKRGRPKKVITPAGQPKTPAEISEKPVDEVPAEYVEAQELHRHKMRMVGGSKVPLATDTEIKNWVDRKAVELLPSVIADIAFDLKYGSPKQRSEARDRILDMHGLRKREAAAGNHATIVLNLGQGEKLGQQLPWLQRVDKSSSEE